jgi:hypothetical protein
LEEGREGGREERTDATDDAPGDDHELAGGVVLCVGVGGEKGQMNK